MIQQVKNRGEVNFSNQYEVRTTPSGTAVAEKINKDTVDLNHTDWQKETYEYFSQLSSRYDGVKFISGDFSQTDLWGLIQGCGYGDFVFVSESFLEEMGKSRESFFQGKLLLEQYLNQWKNTDGGKDVYCRGALFTEDFVAHWKVTDKESHTFSLPEQAKDSLVEKMLEAMKKTSQENQSKFEIKNNSYLLNSASSVYSKLARASGQTQVRSVMTDAGHRIYRIKMAMRDCKKSERDDYQAVINQLRAAIRRGRAKISQLEQEQIMRRKQEKAIREYQIKKAREIEQNLRKRKTARKSAEYAYISNSALDSLLRGERARQAQLAQYRANRLGGESTVTGTGFSSVGTVVGSPTGGSTPFSSLVGGTFSLPTGGIATVSVSTVSLG